MVYMDWLLFMVAMDGCYGLVAMDWLPRIGSYGGLLWTGCYRLVSMEGCYGPVAMYWLFC